MRKNRLLIVLPVGMVILSWLVSCTYDYFEDETNYQVFVSEVLNKTVSDCHVLVYDNAGILVGERFATSPWENPRMARGLFSFKLQPGEYKVYCYTNMDSLSFMDRRDLDHSALILNDNPSGEDYYVQPSDILFQRFAPTIVHTGLLQTDTAQLAHYTGHITVRFKNFPGDISRIKKVQLSAEGVAVIQYLKNETVPSRLTPADRMFHIGELPVQETTGMLEVDHRYLPSLEEGTMRLNYTFWGEDGTVICHLPVEVKDRDTGMPMRLLPGQRIIIEIDSYTTIKISIVGWNEDVEGGNTDLE